MAREPFFLILCDFCKRLSYVRIKNGESVRGVLHGEDVEPLDDLPFPARHLVNRKLYTAMDGEKNGSLPMSVIVSSRGCPFKCTFCSTPVTRPKIRYRSAKSIVDEMVAIYDTCNGNYFFVDDVLTMNKKKTIALCNEILQRGVKVKWSGITRADVFDEELVEKLSAAGCYDLFFGVESGNERIRNDVIEKNVTNAEIRSAIRLCRRYGIHTNIFLMMGFPSETKKEIEDTVNVGVDVEADMIGVHITIPLPGTAVFRHAVEEGMISVDIVDRFIRGEGWNDREAFYEKWPFFIPSGLKLQDLTEARARAYRKFYLRPGWILSRVALWWKNPSRLKQDWSLVKAAPLALLGGKTNAAVS